METYIRFQKRDEWEGGGLEHMTLNPMKVTAGSGGENGVPFGFQMAPLSHR